MPDPGANTSRRVTLPQRAGFWLGLAAFFGVRFLLDLDPDAPQVTATAAVAALMAIWWMTEAIPLPATALLPFVLFPALGIMSAKAVPREFMSWLILLFLGGFLIARCIERWGLHKRIALHILRVVGGEPRRLVLGFMIATAFLSMWLSNTAATMMMFPMALSLIVLAEDLDLARAGRGEPVDPRAPNFNFALLLGVCYSSSIGGVATLIGTPPNGILVTQIEIFFPDAPRIVFVRWMAFALPLACIFLAIAWLVLTRLVFPMPRESAFSGRKFIAAELEGLGPISTEEKRVGAVFASVAILWITRIFWGPALFPDPADPTGSWVDDGTVAMAMALLLFVLPAGRATGGRLLDWHTAAKVPWGILIVIGGGLTLAKGFETSGLSAWIAGRFTGLADLPPLGIVTIIAATLNLVTELTSNTATSQTVMPLLASLARAIRVHPFLLMVPAVLSASCAFMLPVATAPNAIIYGSERVPISKMIKAGVLLNLIGLVLITLTMIVLLRLPAVFQTDLTQFPDWAAP